MADLACAPPLTTSSAMASTANGANKASKTNNNSSTSPTNPLSPRPLTQAAYFPTNPFSKPFNPFDDDTAHSPDNFSHHPTYSQSQSPQAPASASVSPALSNTTPSPPTSRSHTPEGLMQPSGIRDVTGDSGGEGSGEGRRHSADDALAGGVAQHSLNPFEEDDGDDEYASSEGTDAPDELDEEAEGEEAEDDEQQVEVEAALSSLSPLSSLLTSLNSSSHSSDTCDLSGVWEVNQSKSNSLQPLLTTTGVSPALASSIDAASSVVVSTVHHDPQQHTLTIVDESVRGRSISTFYTDGVVRNVVVSGHSSLRRAYEEEEEAQAGGGGGSEEVMQLKRHRLRGGVVRVETQMSNAMEMEDVRVLVDRTVMLQRTTLTRGGGVLVECNRWYDKKESDEERVRGEKEWKEKLDVAELLQKAKQLKRVEAEARRARGARGEDEGETAGNEDEQESEEGEGSDEQDEDEEDDTLDSSHSSTSASPDGTPSNSPLPITLPPPPPPPDFTASFNGTWSVLRNYSQDVTPLLKKMHVSWMDRSMTTQQETVTMNVGRSIVVCVDRSSLGSAELRYQCDGLWHDGMGFGGKEGKVRVAVERKHPFSLTIETSWLKDKRSKFQQLIEPGAEKAAGWQPGVGGRAGGKGGVPLGFVVCKLIDVRVLERRAIIKQMLQYAENGVVRLVCVRYMRKLETKEEKRRGEEQERARLMYERMVEQQRQAAAAHSSTAKLNKKPKRHKKATSTSSTARTQQPQSTAEHIEQIIRQTSAADESATTTTSTTTRSGGASSPSRRYTAGYRRMSISSTSSTQSAAVMLAPNPLLSFLPVRLVVEGGRVGQVYVLLCVGLLGAVCAGSVWLSVWLVVGAAFYLHYHEVVQRSRRGKEAAIRAAALKDGTVRLEMSKGNMEGRVKSGSYDAVDWDDSSGEEKASEMGVT